MLFTIQKNALRLATFVSVLSGTSIAGRFVVADESDTRLVATMLQDEQRRLPPDNTVLFSAATRSVAIQLDALNQLDSSELADTMLTIIDAQGATQELKANKNGIVEINDVKPGPYAVVANNEQAHGTTLLMFEEAPKDSNAVEPSPDLPAPQSVGKGRMTLLNIKSKELISIVDKYLPTSSDSGERLVASDWTSKNGFGPSAFKVRVREDNELYGQVISVLRAGLNGSNVEGTHVTLFNGGNKVGGAFADAAGRFAIPDVEPGFYGIVAAGPAGYGAFAFEVVSGTAVVRTAPAADVKESHQFVSVQAPVTQEILTSLQAESASDVVPVVCIPPSYVPYAVESIRTYYPPITQGTDVANMGGASPIPGSGAMGSGGFGQSGFGGGSLGASSAVGSPAGGFGGGGGGFGGGGFGGGLGGIGAIAAIGAAVAGSSNNSGVNAFVPTQPVSPAVPAGP